MSDLNKFYEKYWIQRFEKEDISGVTVYRARTILSFFNKKNLGKTLDVGCGDGTLLYTLTDRYGLKIDPHGLEISKKASEKAAEKGIKLHTQDVEKRFPFANNFFDTIICSEVLEHLIFPEKTLSEIKRVTKDNSIIIFSVPNLGYFKNRLKLLVGRSPFEQGRYSSLEHLHFWAKDSFERFLVDNGFKILKVRGGFGPKIGKLSYLYPSLLSDTLYLKVKRS
jgi:methionine biosynthesis protein MetW